MWRAAISFNRRTESPRRTRTKVLCTFRNQAAGEGTSRTLNEFASPGQASWRLSNERFCDDNAGFPIPTTRRGDRLNSRSGPSDLHGWIPCAHSLWMGPLTEAIGRRNTLFLVLPTPEGETGRACGRYRVNHCRPSHLRHRGGLRPPSGSAALGLLGVLLLQFTRGRSTPAGRSAVQVPLVIGAAWVELAGRHRGGCTVC